MANKQKGSGYTVGDAIPAESLKGLVSDELFEQLTQPSPYNPTKITVTGSDKRGAVTHFKLRE